MPLPFYCPRKEHKKDEKHDNKQHENDHHKQRGREEKPRPHGESNGMSPKKEENPNLTKRDMKMIEKLHAKIEFHEIREEYDEVKKLKHQIVGIADNASVKAAKKAEKASAKA